MLLEVLRDRQDDVLRFTTDLAVPPTSNQAERDLRPAECQQNVSGRLTSAVRTQDRYTIRGYLSTAVKHGHNALRARRLHHRPPLAPLAPLIQCYVNHTTSRTHRPAFNHVHRRSSGVNAYLGPSVCRLSAVLGSHTSRTPTPRATWRWHG